MGAINYGSSEKFLNLGIRPDLFDQDEDIENQDDMDFIIQDFYDEIQAVIDDNYFAYYEIKLEYGYYDGVYLNISEGENCYCYNYYASDKKEQNLELTKLKQLLIKLIKNYGFICYSPSWCTGYSNIKDTLQLLANAIKKEREEIKKKEIDK